MLIRTLLCTILTLAALPSAQAQTPTISGTSAFWYLGNLPSGVFSDGGTCSGHSGPCYFTQSTLTASPSSGSGYSWSVSRSGAGNVTLSCTTNCSSSVTVTATHASSGCSSDVSIFATFNGLQSSGYGLTLVTPSSTTLQSGPTDMDPNSDPGAYETDYLWNIFDSCGNNDTGIDQAESFGSWTDDFFISHGVHNNWFAPLPGGAYLQSGIYFFDAMAHGGGVALPQPHSRPKRPPAPLQ